MSRENNMEMERSRRQHEYEKKFGRDREEDVAPADAKLHNRRMLRAAMMRRNKYLQEHEQDHWG